MAPSRKSSKNKESPYQSFTLTAFRELVKKPRVFKSLTGLSPGEFDQLFEKFVPAWIEHEHTRLDRPDRQRAIGGGRKYKLKLTVLRALGEDPFGWPEPPKRGEGKSVAQALQDYPDLLAIVDATEQRMQRPSDDERQRAHYSGKKKTYTRKTAFVVNQHGRMRGVTSSRPGSKHDLKHGVESESIDDVPDDLTIIGDAGFDGLQNYYPERSIGTPHKALRNHPLPLDQKLANQVFSSERIIVEHTLDHRKHFKVLAYPFRHATEVYDDIFRAIAGIINDRIDRRLALAPVA